MSSFVPLAVAHARGRLRGVRRVAAAALLASALLSIGPSAGGPWRITGPSVALAASPTPSAEAGDTRSAGEGPGIVGSPFVAIAGVLGIALVAAGLTLLYVRLSGPRPGLAAAPGRPAEEGRHGPPPSRDRG